MDRNKSAKEIQVRPVHSLVFTPNKGTINSINDDGSVSLSLNVNKLYMALFIYTVVTLSICSY